MFISSYPHLPDSGISTAWSFFPSTVINRRDAQCFMLGWKIHASRKVEFKLMKILEIHLTE